MCASSFEGQALNLPYLTELSDVAAESLAKHKGELHLASFGDLTELSDAAVESLSKHQGKINGQNPKRWAGSLKPGNMEFFCPAAKLIDDEVARDFLDDAGIDLSKATEITDEAAKLLSKYEGELYLTGLTEITDAAHRGLSRQGHFLKCPLRAPVNPSGDDGVIG